MLKFTKGLFLVMGLAAAVTAVTFMSGLFSQVDELIATSQSGGVAVAGGPKRQIWIAMAAAALTGLFIGMGLALPRRTARSIRNETRARLAMSAPVAAPASDIDEE